MFFGQKIAKHFPYIKSKRKYKQKDIFNGYKFLQYQSLLVLRKYFRLIFNSNSLQLIDY